MARASMSRQSSFIGNGSPRVKPVHQFFAQFAQYFHGFPNTARSSVESAVLSLGLGFRRTPLRPRAVSISPPRHAWAANRSLTTENAKKRHRQRNWVRFPAPREAPWESAALLSPGLGSFLQKGWLLNQEPLRHLARRLVRCIIRNTLSPGLGSFRNKAGSLPSNQFVTSPSGSIGPSSEIALSLRLGSFL